MSTPDIDKQVMADGFDRGASASAETARSLMVGAALLEQVVFGRMGGAAQLVEIALARQGLLQPGVSLDTLRLDAVAAIRGKAEFEAGIGESLASQRGELLGGPLGENPTA